MQRHPGITLVPAHDEHVLQALPRFPELGVEPIAMNLRNLRCSCGAAWKPLAPA